MKHNRGRIALISFLLLTLLVQQWKGSALISGIGYSIVYAQETNSETGSDEGLQDTDSGSVMMEELQNPSGEQDYGRGSYSQYGEQYTSNTNQAGQTGITDTFSSESDQGDETPVIELSSSDAMAGQSGAGNAADQLAIGMSSNTIRSEDIVIFGDDSVRTSAVKAPPEGSQGSMTVNIKWLDYDESVIEPDSSSLPYRVALTLQKMTGNDASTARDVTAAEYSNDLTRNAERSSWTASWSNLPYREGENYTVRVAPSEDYEFVTEVQAWDLSGDTARWDTTLVLQLKEPEEINVTAELRCYPMEGKTLSDSDLPYSIPVTLYQDNGSGGLTRAEDADGNELDPVTFYRNSHYNSVIGSIDYYYWRGEFKNVPNKENITYVPKADELPAYFREDSNTVTGKTKADGIKVRVVYTYIQERITIPVKVEWYLADGETLNTNISSERDSVTEYLNRPDGSQYGYINVSADGDGNWLGSFYNVPKLDDQAQEIAYTIRKDDVGGYRCEDVTMLGGALTDGFLVKYTHIKTLSYVANKVDAGTGDEVDGAVIALYEKDDAGNLTPIERWVSVSGETHDFGDKLEAGHNYVLREITAPTGYGRVTTDIEISVSADGELTSSLQPSVQDDGTFVYLIEDSAIRFNVSKTDAANGEELDGAVLTVFEIDAAGNEKKIDSWISAGGITHDFGTNLEPGKSYVLREETAPTGYKKITTDIAVTVNEDGTITTGLPKATDSEGNVVYLVQDSKITVKVSKVDVADGKEIAGARIQLFDEINQLVDEWTSSDTEVYVIENIQAGVTYTLKETIAPEGYEITSDTTFSIDEEGNITSSGTVSDEGVILIEDAKTSVKVSKVDVADGKEVAGATIQVIDSTGKVVDEWTSSDKEVHTITGLETGVTYKLKETVAPDGYTIAAETTFSLDAEGKVTSSGTVTTDGVLLVEDAKTKVKVSKIDKADGAELEGATLQILDENGDLVIGWVSGTEATEIEGLKTGVEYTLKETKAPGGYAIAAETTFTIDETGKVTTTGKTITDEEGKTILLVENQKKIENANVKISKTDIADGREIAGATIQILDENGDVVEIDGKKLEWVSGTEAKEIEGLKTGVEYTLKETVAPDGYTIASETTFTIDETGKVTSTGTVTGDGVMLVEDA